MARKGLHIENLIKGKVIILSNIIAKLCKLASFLMRVKQENIDNSI